MAIIDKQIANLETVFSKQGFRILRAAIDESKRRKQNRVAVEHVLFALAKEEPYLFRVTLSDIGHNPQVVRDSIEKRLTNDVLYEADEVSIGADASDLFGRAIQEARLHDRE